MAGDRFDDRSFLDDLRAAGVEVVAPPYVQAGHRLVKAAWLDRGVVVDALRGLKPHGFASPSRSSVEVWSEENLIVHVMLDWHAAVIASAVAAVARGGAGDAQVRDGSWGAGWTSATLGAGAEQLLDGGEFASDVPAEVLREDLAGRLLLDASPGMWQAGVPAGARSNACRILAERLLGDPGLLHRATLLESPSPSHPVRVVSTPPPAGVIPGGW